MMKAPLLPSVLSQADSATSSMSVDTSKPSLLRASSLQQRKEVPAYALYLLIAVAILSSLLSVALSVTWAVGSPSKGAAGYTGLGSSSSTGLPLPFSPSSAMDNTTTDLPNVLTPIVPQYPSTTMMGQVKTHDLLHLLSGLYAVAMNYGGGNRAITGPGFNASVEYLMANIRARTNLVNIEQSYFLRPGTSSGISNPFFTANIMDKMTPPFVYGQDWLTYVNSAASSNATSATLYFIDGGGCDMGNWTDVLGDSPSQPFFAIVYRTTTCVDNNRIGFAQMYGATGVILASLSGGPGRGSAPVATALAVIGISGDTALSLIGALQTYGSSGVSVAINIEVQYTHIVVTNICGDTPAGDATSVVVVGGHSDGVARGPGTNDDGSGSVATLALAIAMTNLMNNATLKYQPTNMVKFCWFGAEEQGLLGSQEVVRVGLQRDNDQNARVGSRARDWAIMIDLDMLGSLNFQNYVYDANVYIPPSTPSRAHNGSKIMSNLFFEFFDANGLPRDSDRFDGRSDYGPFLAAGIPAGGVDAGADKRKTEETRERYQRLTGWGGVANAINDQCYHQACDHIGNIHWGVYTNMTQSAAYVLERLAMQSGLRQWLGNPLNVQGEPGKYDMLPLEYRWGPEVREGEDEVDQF